MYCKYALVNIRNISAIALIDSGNTWRTVISESFAAQIGFPTSSLLPLNIATIGTAKQGSGLTVLGETPTHVHISFSNCPLRFKVRPIVLASLSMPVNISGPFLKRHNIDQLHSQNCLPIQNYSVPLLHDLSDPFTTEPTNSNIYLSQSITVPPCSYLLAPAVVSAIRDGYMPKSGGGVSLVISILCIFMIAIPGLIRWLTHPLPAIFSLAS